MAASFTVMETSYRKISPNCLYTMSLMESCRPKPVSSSAVQPAMPVTVMKKRFL